MTTEWRTDFENAPKDGRALLGLINGERNEIEMAVIYWERTGYNREPCWAYGPEGSEHAFRTYCEPTHWMPLPEPPQ